MPGARLPMRKICDVLRLSAAGLSKRKIAASLGMSGTAAGDCLRRAGRAGVFWPLPEGLTDEALERRLYPPSAIAAKESRPRPNWAAIHRELRRPGVTLQLLWEEHRATHPDGYGYSRFCELYRAFEARLSPTMRQTHVAGERLFVDYAGTTLAVIDPSTGEAMPAQLFVAALGASNYTYAEATWTQGLADWIGSHTRAFAFHRRGPGDGSEPTRAFRGVGPPGAQAVAGRALRLRRVERMPGRARLPCRDRQALLLGAPWPAAREGLGARRHMGSARASAVRLVGLGSPSPEPAAGRSGRMRHHCRAPEPGSVRSATDHSTRLRPG